MFVLFLSVSCWCACVHAFCLFFLVWSVLTVCRSVLCLPLLVRLHSSDLSHPCLFALSFSVVSFFSFCLSFFSLSLSLSSFRPLLSRALSLLPPFFALICGAFIVCLLCIISVTLVRCYVIFRLDADLLMLVLWYVNAP